MPECVGAVMLHAQFEAGPSCPSWSQDQKSCQCRRVSAHPTRGRALTPNEGRVHCPGPLGWEEARAGEALANLDCALRVPHTKRTHNVARGCTHRDTAQQARARAFSHRARRGTQCNKRAVRTCTHRQSRPKKLRPPPPRPPTRGVTVCASR